MFLNFNWLWFCSFELKWSLSKFDNINCNNFIYSLSFSDNVVNEIVALIDGLENDKPVIGALPCDTAVTNLTLVRDVNMPVHQVNGHLFSGHVHETQGVVPFQKQFELVILKSGNFKISCYNSW